MTQKRTWKFWALVALAVSVFTYALIALVFFVATVVFLDEEGVILTQPPISTSSPVAPEAVDVPDAPLTFPAGRIEDIDFGAYSPDLASSIDLKMGENRLDAIDKIRLYFAPEPGVNIVNMTSSSFERNDGSVLLFARNNIPDDAIFAEEVYAVFSGPGDAQKFNQKLAAYGLRLKCRRGDNAMEWTTNLCP